MRNDLPAKIGRIDHTRAQEVRLVVQGGEHVQVDGDVVGRVTELSPRGSTTRRSSCGSRWPDPDLRGIRVNGPRGARKDRYDPRRTRPATSRPAPEGPP